MSPLASALPRRSLSSYPFSHPLHLFTTLSFISPFTPTLSAPSPPSNTSLISLPPWSHLHPLFHILPLIPGCRRLCDVLVTMTPSLSEHKTTVIPSASSLTAKVSAAPPTLLLSTSHIPPTYHKILYVLYSFSLFVHSTTSHSSPLSPPLSPPLTSHSSPLSPPLQTKKEPLSLR